MLNLTPPLTLNRAQTAARLGVSLNVFDCLVRTGRLRVIRAGRRLLIPEIEITAFLTRELERVAQ